MSTPTDSFAPYQAWSATAADLNGNGAGALSGALLDIVAVEGPVQQGVIVKRWLEAVPTTGDVAPTMLRVQLKEALQELEDDGALVSEFERAGDAFCRVYRLPDAPPVRVRERGPRTPFEIPLSELRIIWQRLEREQGSASDDELIDHVADALGFSFLVDNARSRIRAAGRELRPDDAVTSDDGAGTADVTDGGRQPLLSVAQSMARAAEPAKPPQASGFGERRELLLDVLHGRDVGERLPDGHDGWIEYQVATGRRIRFRLGFTRLQIMLWIDAGPGSETENRDAANELLEQVEAPAPWRAQAEMSPAYRGAGVELMTTLALQRDAPADVWLAALGLRLDEAWPLLETTRDAWRSIPEAEAAPVVEGAPHVPPALMLLRNDAFEADQLGPRVIIDHVLSVFAAAARPFVLQRFGVDSIDPSSQLAQLRSAKRNRELDDVFDEEQQSAIFTLTRVRNVWAHNGQLTRLSAIRATDAACQLVEVIAPRHLPVLVQARYSLLAAQAYSTAMQYAKARQQAAS